MIIIDYLCACYEKDIVFFVSDVGNPACNGAEDRPEQLRAGAERRNRCRNDIQSNTGNDISYWLNYSKYYSRHIGGRFGVQYMPEYMRVKDFVSFPMALSLRTGMREANETMTYGALVAMDMLDAWLWEGDNIVLDMFAVFLITLINRAEFFVGLTPGYIIGPDSLRETSYLNADGTVGTRVQGIRKAGDFYCSADAGLSFSWRIWRFTLNMTPTVRYNFTDNFRIYSDNESTVYPQDTPIPWLFSMNFGIGYLF